MGGALQTMPLPQLVVHAACPQDLLIMGKAAYLAFVGSAPYHQYAYNFLLCGCTEIKVIKTVV